MNDGSEADNRYVAQEGGDHYQAEYQHWDWVTDIGMGYLPGNATKYVARWRKKNGLADLKKAMSYIDKMIAKRLSDDLYEFNNPIGNGYKLQKFTERFIEVNNLGPDESRICVALCHHCPDEMLKLAKSVLQTLIFSATAQGIGAATLTHSGAGLPHSGAAQGAGQATAGKGATGGMEHPFGYDGEDS